MLSEFRESVVANRLVRHTFGISVLVGMSAACSDDDTHRTTLNARGSGGSAASMGGSGGGAGAPGRAGSGEATAMDAGVGPSDAGPVDRDVFRPEERAATPELVAMLQVPAGFRVNVFADQLQHARMLAVRDADVYLTRPEQGDVLRLRDTNADGVADERVTVASGLALVHGIVFRGADVYLATPNQVYRASVDAQGGFSAPAVLIPDLPDGGQHGNRTLGVGPDDALYISIGSSCDACRETDEEHATILRASLDGSSRAVFARGLRNTIGFGWHPTTGVLWGMDHGSDFRGGDVPPEELNRIEAGSDYGWPYCFGQRQVDPIIDDPPQGSKAAYCANTTPAALETQAHNAPIGLVFYTANGFPAEYRNNAFVAMHGSWNRYPPTGYSIVRIVFDSAGEPRRFEDFLGGFLIQNGAATFGRPAGINVAPDGSLLFSDDSNGVIYRVSYPGADADAGAGGGGVPAADAGAPDAG
jgi:glucose/arabinose dehydrogenase